MMCCYVSSGTPLFTPRQCWKIHFRHNNDLHIQHLFQYYNKEIILHRHVRWTGIQKACFGQSSKQSDWFASSYDSKWWRKRNIHMPWTISTVQCFSFSSTVGFVLVDNWVEFAIFWFSFVFIVLLKCTLVPLLQFCD